MARSVKRVDRTAHLGARSSRSRVLPDGGSVVPRSQQGRLAPCRLGAALDRVEELEKRTMEAIRAQCPKVKRLSSDAVLGPYD